MQGLASKTLILITKAACVALVFCYLSLYLALWVDVLNLLTPFVFQTAICALILSFFLILIQQKNWAIGALILTLLFSTEYIQAHRLLTPLPSHVEGGYTVDIASFNQLRYNDDADQFFDLLQIKGKDLIVILEANKSSADKAKTLKQSFPHQFSALGLSSKSTIILSRWPLIDLERIQMFENDHEENFLVKFRIKPETDKPALQFYVLHTKSPVPVTYIEPRNKELRYLAELIKSDSINNETPVIALGDFNITAHNPHFKKLLSQTGLLPSPAYGFAAHSWPSILPWLLRFQIDHILISDNITTISFNALKATGSDHLALSGLYRIAPTKSY